MNNTIDKQKLMDWITEDMSKFGRRNLENRYVNLKVLIDKIQSGAFDAPEHPIIQAIRDFMPTGNQWEGYNALIAWLESTTSFELDAGTEKGAGHGG